MNLKWMVFSKTRFLVLLSLIISNLFVMPVQANSEANNIQWLDAQESDGIVYLLSDSPNVIMRYRLSTESWLPAINLSSIPSAFRVNSNMIYVAYAGNVYKMKIDGTEETYLLTVDKKVVSLHVVDQILFLNYSFDAFTYLLSWDLTKGVVIDRQSFYPEALSGPSLAPKTGNLFGHYKYNNSFSIVMRASFNADGKFIERPQRFTDYHEYSNPARTWVSPNERYFIDDGGIVNNSSDLSYRDNLGGRVDDLIFYKDLPIVLSFRTITAFTNTFIPTGSIFTFNPIQRLFVYGDNVFAFYANTQGPQVEKIALSQLNLAPSEALADPNELEYTPDNVFLGNDEIVYLLSKKYQSIFRWSVSERRYLSSIPLRDNPDFVTYSADDNQIYIAYLDHTIYQMNLYGPFEEKKFLELSDRLCGLASAGNFVFTCDESHWKTRSVFSKKGELLSHYENSYGHYAQEYVWNPVLHRLFRSSRDYPYCYEVMDIDENGKIANSQGVCAPFDALSYPIRVKQDGASVLIGAGLIYDGVTLEQVNALSTNFIDGGWKGDTIATIRQKGLNSELQKWSPPTFKLVKKQMTVGAPHKLFPVQEGWLAITLLANKPRFSIWSDDLLPSSSEPFANFSASAKMGRAPLEITFTNLSEGAPDLTSEWSFGDGNTSTEKNPVHSYSKDGIYTVKLTVNGFGGSDTIVKKSYVQVSYFNLYIPYFTTKE